MMSKEAKIGLLFSLIFIVGIAVILRSVHEGTVETFDRDTIMNVDSGRAPAQNLSSTVESLTKDTPKASQQTSDIVSQINASNRREQSQPNNNAYAGNQQVNNNPAPVRYSQPLPGSSANQGQAITIPPSGEVERAINSTSNLEQAQPKDYSQYQKLRQQIAQGRPTTNTQPEKKAKTVVHQVKDGENLTEIAMKYYGKKEGNRLVNIRKIYDANRKIMKSIDSLRVGQRLTIPPLEGKTLLASDTGSSSSKTVNIGKNKIYTVKENDSLWKIAAKELGNGARFNDIIKLNSKILKDANCLQPGMKLVIPQ